MPSPDFDMLCDRLLRSGVAARHVSRAISELRDHFEDIACEVAENGATPKSASQQASERIGDVELIAQQYLSRPELKSWIYRHPQMARIVLPLAYVMALPSIPIHAGLEMASFIGKWCACFLLSAFVTAALLLLMHVSIAIT